MLAKGSSSMRTAPRAARFGPGDRVRARNLNPRTHTRLPRYARGHVAAVAATRGCHVFPDVHAHGGGEDPQWLYTIEFSGRELWGAEADPTSMVSIDAFEPYPEPA
jgi:nitrile hydratase